VPSASPKNFKRRKVEKKKEVFLGKSLKKTEFETPD